MTTVTKTPGVPEPRPLSDLSNFRRTTPAAAVGRLTPFLAAATAADPAPALHGSDRSEQAMDRLRHPFASE
ncbi:hypothetical protein [Actinoplanes philippinensis]|uniref:hypothetical protein n=1 Tax=Actinoplanes philippinensis TaxID=35752 RepID=UPI0033FB01ED